MRLYKLAAIRQLSILESPSWSCDEKLRQLLLERTFDVGLTNLTVTSPIKEKEPDTGNAALDVMLKIFDRMEKQLQAVPASTPAVKP